MPGFPLLDYAWDPPAGLSSPRVAQPFASPSTPTTYTLTGDYRDVRRFIYSLETAPEFIVLENIGLSSAIGEEQQPRTLAMTLDIATYFRSRDGAE